MRVIKFRGKCVDSKEWVHGFYFHVEDGNPNGTHHIVEHTTHHQHNVRKVVHIIDPETIGQYVREKDKAGIKCYEGDIMQRYKKDGTPYKETKVVPSIEDVKTSKIVFNESLVIGNIHTPIND